MKTGSHSQTGDSKQFQISGRNPRKSLCVTFPRLKRTTAPFANGCWTTAALNKKERQSTEVVLCQYSHTYLPNRTEIYHPPSEFRFLCHQTKTSSGNLSRSNINKIKPCRVAWFSRRKTLFHTARRETIHTPKTGKNRVACDLAPPRKHTRWFNLWPRVITSFYSLDSLPREK